MDFKKIIGFTLLCLLLLNFQCDDDDTSVLPHCSEVVIDNDAYLSAQTDFYNVSNVYIDGNCLVMDISASGCDGSTWEFALIDSGNVAESSPLQRFLKLTLHNNEDCLAVFTQEVSFDLVPLRVEDANEVLLNIEGLDESVLYVY